jgi:hypothetical protein
LLFTQFFLKSFSLTPSDISLACEELEDEFRQFERELHGTVDLGRLYCVGRVKLVLSHELNLRQVLPVARHVVHLGESSDEVDLPTPVLQARRIQRLVDLMDYLFLLMVAGELISR